MQRLLLFLLIWFSFNIFSSNTTVQGYRDQFYELNPEARSLCQYDSKFQSQWCVDIQKDALGMYIGFNQVIVYSKKMIQAIDVIRQQIKWAINMNQVFKIHINYPVIVIFSIDKTITGYDYFSGFQLWQKFSTGYSNMFEADANLWVLKQSSLDQIDVISGDIIQSVALSFIPYKLIGDNLYFFYESGNQLYHHSLYSKSSEQVGLNYNVLDRSSSLVFVGNESSQQLRTMSNRIVSDDVKVDLFKIHSVTKSTFAYAIDNHLYFINHKGTSTHEFTQPSNNAIIKYGYMLNNKVRVFYDDGQDVWILKRQKKNKFDLDM